jgi:hypothetical protein
MKTLLSVAVFSFIAYALAPAQTFEVSVLAGYPRISGAPLGTINSENGKDDDSKLKGNYSYGATLTINTPGYYGHELGYIRNRATFQTKLRTGTDGSTVTLEQDKIVIQQAFYNFLIYFMPKGERFRPFMTGGLQMYQYGEPHVSGWPGGGARSYGANYGGGLKIKLFKHALVRFDFRDCIGGKPYDLTFEDPMYSGGWFRQLEASFGIAIGF